MYLVVAKPVVDHRVLEQLAHQNSPEHHPNIYRTDTMNHSVMELCSEDQDDEELTEAQEKILDIVEAVYPNSLSVANIAR